jgi:TfoX/Sxy family transcriptional regulator of competence genes
MAFDEQLAARIRAHLAKRSGVAERKMFGGIIFMLQGNMCCGVHRDALIARVGAEKATGALAEPHTRVFDLTVRPMKAWVLVDPQGLTETGQLEKWVDRAAKYAGSLPPKY